MTLKTTPNAAPDRRTPKPPKQPHSDDQAIGRQVRRLREHRHMTQATLGQALGISFQQVQKYENAANRIGGSRLMAIARILGVAPSVLFENCEGFTSARCTPDWIEDLDQTTVALARTFQQIESKTNRQAIAQVIHAAANPGQIMPRKKRPGAPHTGAPQTLAAQ
jgi:transcriptional regulator with XRE-family HTH domain